MYGGKIGNTQSNGDSNPGSSGNFNDGESAFGGGGVDLAELQVCLRARILSTNHSGLSVGEEQYSLVLASKIGS